MYGPNIGLPLQDMEFVQFHPREFMSWLLNYRRIHIEGGFLAKQEKQKDLKDMHQKKTRL